ncbi:MAG: sugar phosphate nucleotidyltransferase, partial [Treponema sp.]|nr:sugar phosphate nucleotidyltransferase [Treponema sp.]
AIACALLFIDWVQAGRERNILVLASDHIIQPIDTFKTDASAAAAMAQADKLVVFGIPPERPETGYGYIEAAEALTIPPDESVRSRRKYEPEVFGVAAFREKPDLEKAKAFVASKKFYWNSGMFGFSSKFMISCFRRIAPDVINPFSKLWAPTEHSYRTKKGLRVLEAWDGLDAAYRKTRAISFDYAIAEKCDATVMVKAGFSWTDVGSWDEYARLAGNTGTEVYGTGGKPETCFVDSDIPVALCGVEDLIVVVRSGQDGGKPAVLIAKKGETQRIKEIVEKIKKAGRADLL